jgi:maltose alpha-D-glucosyltransferase/alpha-amylase
MTVPGSQLYPGWYKDATIYEVHVRAFCDGNGDGVGDFAGLVGKLDYLRELGVTALWLLPFYPSPLKDDGYDIADYTDVHPAYGTLRDFKHFLAEAHRQGLQVVTELVLNHTSDQHVWFQRARRAPPGSPERDFYVWSDTPERYEDARVIFHDFELSNWSWDPVAGAYYWHRFYSHQPDLNYDNPAVRQAVLEVVDFWLGLGVDGLRLDAAPYLYEAEGTPSENLPLTHAFLKELRRHVDTRFPGRMLLAEANQWPEDAAAYFGSGDECHMAFHFPLMPRLYLAVRTEDRLPIVDVLAQTPPIPESCQWAIFLRNHDELTLEMVSDEERLYLYRAFARDPEARVNLGIRRRLAPLLGNDRRRIELLNALLCSLPGTPVIYYGDEIGMGDNVYLGDRNGVRTPMQWSADRNAGFSRAHPQRLYLPLIVDHEFHHEAVHVEAQQENPHSLLNWMRRLLALRRRHPAFGRGDLELLHPTNHRILAFLRRHGDERLLIVANLSRFVQSVELDLSPYRGLAPVELFGRTPFRPIGDEPYTLTLSPHTFYWFALEPVQDSPHAAREAGAPVLAGSGSWDDFLGDGRGTLEAVLPDVLRTSSWFGGRGRRVLATRIVEVIPIPHAGTHSYVTFVHVDYADGEPETYIVPLTFAGEDWDDSAHTIVALLRREDEERSVGALVDAMRIADLPTALRGAIAHGRRSLKGTAGAVAATRAPAFRQVVGPAPSLLEPVIVGADQTHTSVVFGDRLVLKLFRRVEAGIHPELEIGRALTEMSFPHAPPLVGSIEYRPHHGEATTLAVLHGFVPSQGDAWQHALAAARDYLERAPVAADDCPPIPAPPDARTLLDLAEREAEPASAEGIPDLRLARLLGRRTAELHGALAAAPDPAFAPVPLTPFAQRSLYQAMRGLTGRVFRSLRRERDGLPEPLRRQAGEILGREEEILARFRRLVEHRIAATAIRCHGDYHLGQVLVTGDDVAIIDFEGEPSFPLAERRLKRPPLRDVVSMLRSFAYAADAALMERTESGAAWGEAISPELECRARHWQLANAAAFLREYLAAIDPGLAPSSRADLALLLDVFLLEKTVYQLGHELRARPGWVAIPLRGLQQLLAPPDDAPQWLGA